MLWRRIKQLFEVLVVLLFIYVALIGIGSAVITIVIPILDLIFRTHISQNLRAYFEQIIQPYSQSLWATVVDWFDKVGLTPFFGQVGDIVSIITSEVFRSFVLFILFLLAGLAFYHLRVVHRIIYGFVELIFAVIAMLIAINGIAGGDFSVVHILALFSGLYIMGLCPKSRFWTNFLNL